MLKKKEASCLILNKYIVHFRGWLEMRNLLKRTDFIQCGLSHCWYKLLLEEKCACGYGIKKYLETHMPCGFFLFLCMITSKKKKKKKG